MSPIDINIDQELAHCGIIKSLEKYIIPYLITRIVGEHIVRHSEYLVNKYTGDEVYIIIIYIYIVFYIERHSRILFVYI